MRDTITAIAGYVIPHDQQRYDTAGDWIFNSGHGLIVKASDTGDWRYNFLLMFHEQAEAAQCVYARVPEEIVSTFDKLYEAKRANDTSETRAALQEAFGCVCEITEDSEPGDDVHAPYYHQHQIATQVEKILAEALGVHWPTYDQAICALPDHEGAPTT